MPVYPRNSSGGVIPLVLVMIASAARAGAQSNAPAPVSVLMPIPLDAPAVLPEADRPEKRSTLLEEVADRAVRGEAWQEWGKGRGLLLKGDEVLVEIRLKQTAMADSVQRLERFGLRRHVQNVPTLLEAWVPAKALTTVAGEPEVLSVNPARIVKSTGTLKPLVGSVTTEGVTASGLDPYHSLGANGSGAIIAVIDGGFQGWAALQTSGDWPPTARLRRFEVSGSTVTDCAVGTCTTFEASLHGAACVEIAYDTAPGATFLVYKTTTVGEWYQALLHASDAALNGTGVADVVSASLGAPLDGIGDGSNCPAIWGTPCGTIAEASEIARSRGTFVVNAAGNARIDHWGGVYTPSSGDANIHTWSGTNAQVNYFGNGSNSAWCIPNGFRVTGELFWDDWTNVNHDYDLELHEFSSSTGWNRRAQSIYAQNGGSGQQPQEYISWTASSNYNACGSGLGVYGFKVIRYSAATNRNLQFFASYDLNYRVPARSLGFPADSANVFAVGALTVSDGTSQAYYSGEGPRLGPGGTLTGATYPKIDGTSFASVSTVSYGASGFAGTSAATPHAAGVAAVLTQLRIEKPVERGSQPAGLQRAMELVAQDGDNDLGTAGQDTVYGWGRLRLRQCSVGAGIVGGWNLVTLPCDRRTENTPAGVFGSQLGTFNTDWGLWRWNPGTSSYQRISSSTEPLNLGEGYWIYRATASPGATMAGLVADRTEAYPRSVTGTSGLGRPHMVGAPRTFSIPWNQVKFFYGGAEHTFSEAYAAGKIRNLMWTWNRGTQQYDVFDGLLGEGATTPGEGMWVRVLEDVEIRFPAEVSGGGGGAPQPQPPVGWTAQLTVTSDAAAARVQFGHRAGAVDGFDHNDAEQLTPPAAAPLRVAFPHLDWKEYAANYVRDYRATKQTDEWMIHVTAAQAGQASLTWSAPAWVVASSILVDESSGKAIPVANLFGRYTMQLTPGTRVLRWRLGARTSAAGAGR